ncbi:MAG TPA: ABC transporter ATP-binding protein [Candidatus Poseidoniaceae archaeon]|nr:ABC transporter ATP-binding protein [Candidatus Poseidoniaceae archaeon]
MADALLELESVNFHHKIPSPKIMNPFNKSIGLGINDISLNLISGNIIGLIGPNGAGKTTLMKVLSGLLIPDDGKIKINNLKLENKNRPNWTKEFIGMMPENVHWYGSSTPYQVIKKILIIRNMDISNIEKILEQVGLSMKSHEALDTLSQGMHQRLSLACALIGNPSILLLDEPMNGLDPVAREAFTGVLKNLAKNGKAILISSHQLAELERMVDSVILMHDGSVIEKGNLTEIRNKYGIHHDFVLKLPNKIKNIDEMFSKNNLEDLEVEQKKVDDYYSIIINAPKDGWNVEIKQKILKMFFSNDLIPFDFTSPKIELVEILAAVTGLDVDKIGMSIQRKSVGGEEE